MLATTPYDTPLDVFVCRTQLQASYGLVLLPSKAPLARLQPECDSCEMSVALTDSLPERLRLGLNFRAKIGR